MTKIGIAISTHGNTPEQITTCLNSVYEQIGNHDTKVVVYLTGWNGEQFRAAYKFNNVFKVYTNSTCLGFAGDWNKAVGFLGDCDYINFVHADDFIDNDHIDCLMNSIGDNDICFASLKYIEPYSQRIKYAIKRLNLSLLWKQREYITDVNCTVESLLKNYTLTCFALIKRKVWDEIGGFTKWGSQWDDFDFWIKTKKLGYTMTSCKKPTYNYFVHPYPKGMKERAIMEINELYKTKPNEPGR